MSEKHDPVPMRDWGEASRELVFWLNGCKVVLTNPDPTVLLVEYLHSIGLTGTKVGCGQGGCGACTVMVSQRDPATGAAVHRAVNSCLRPLCAVDGTMVTTTEGIGSVREALDPTQFCIAAKNASQCGFCTPGFVMNAHAFLQQKPSPSQQEMEDIFGGNLCRCTGYRPILHAMRTLAHDYDTANDATQKCLMDPSYPVQQRKELARIDLNVLPTAQAARRLHFSGSGHEWFRPATFDELQRLKKQLVAQAGRENVKLVFGNTASGVYQQEKPKFLIDISGLAELARVAEKDTGIEVGANVSIQQLIDFAKDVCARRPAEQTTGLQALTRHAVFIAGYQVRSSGSVAGNIFMTRAHARRGGPFPSDLFTILATLGADIVIRSEEYDGGSRTWPLAQMPDVEELPGDAVIASFHIPFTRAREYVQTHRVARRMQMAHPIVNAGFRFQLSADGCVEEATIVYGGLAAMTYRAVTTERSLIGKACDQKTLRGVMAVLKKEVADCTIPMEEEGIGTEYRRQLAENFFFKFFLHLAESAQPVAAQHRSAAHNYERPLSHGTQEYTEYPELFPLTKPIVKRAAFVQATGEVKYTQDLSLPAGGLHAVMVKSSRPHARFTFTKQTTSLEALRDLLLQRFADVKAFITVEDIPAGGQNLIGLGEDDPVFSNGVATSVGAALGLVVATTLSAARAAAAFVEQECIDYVDLPAVLTLEQAIAQDTAMPMIRRALDPDEDVQQRIPKLTRAGSDAAWLSDPKQPLAGTEIASGVLETGPQAHFYLETMCALAVPGMYNQITVFSSTQNPNGDQARIARALGVQANQVTVIVEQIGGGFGGKQHRASIVGAQAAVAARALNRPVRLLYDRPTDTLMVGKRHPYRGEYHIAYQRDGIVKGLHLDLKSEAGDTYDCSFAVMDLSLLQSDGCYNVETMQAGGTVYRTNKASNTAFRTFGTVQPYAVFEDAFEQVAHRLSQTLGRRVLPEEIRRKNLYRSSPLCEESGNRRPDFDRTHFGQDLFFCNIRELWDSLYKSSDFEKRAEAVEQFNRANRWRKRGIAMLPQKYGIAFTEPRGSLNASSALVNVNMADGSVLVQHGGVEMGQGLNTKIAQLAANTLGIPLEWVRVAGISTDVIVNAPATAASTGYDLNGGAVEKACRTLRSRLETFCRDLEQFNPRNCIEHWRYDWIGSWQEIVFKAWFNRINLSAAELYKNPHYEGPSERNPRGKPFLYFVFSAACSEVEIDVLTGEFTILRADILYDPGKSPNPAIDIGQLEGGYIQGVGFATSEELVYDEKGGLVTDNIWSYKPPCSKSIPLDFRVKLHPVDESRNAREIVAEKQAVKSSKTAGEPGLTLGLSAYFAIKRAVMDARRELTGRTDWLRLDLPATCQKIQMACGVTTEALTLE